MIVKIKPAVIDWKTRKQPVLGLNLLNFNVWKSFIQDFLGGAVDKNSLANAGTQVQSLVQEDSTCRRATGTVCHHYWSPSALEPTRHNCWATCDKHWSPLTWSPCSATREATAMRSPYGSMKSMWPLLATTREGPCAAKKTQCSQNLKKKNQSSREKKI